MQTDLRTALVAGTAILALAGCDQKRAPVVTNPGTNPVTQTGQNPTPESTTEDLAQPAPENQVEAPVVTNPDQAQMAVNEVQLLTEPIFEKVLNRKPLTDQDRNDLRKALPIVDRLIAYDPVSRAFASIKGKTLIGLGQYEEAEKQLKNAILLKPEPGQTMEIMIYAGLEADLSRALYEQGKHEEAFEHIQLARIALPNDPYFMTDASTILIELGNLKDARTICERALKADPGHLPALELIEKIDNTNQT